jgi:hypothetical protein
MKSILSCILSFLIFTGCGQQHKTIMENKPGNGDVVTLITTFHKSNATKDGYYVDGYVVDISSEEANRLDGKKIKITGHVTIIKGLNNEAPQYDKEGHRVISQGRADDTRFILDPRIDIIQD